MIENRYFRKLNMRNLKPLVGTIHELSLHFWVLRYLVWFDRGA